MYYNNIGGVQEAKRRRFPKHIHTPFKRRVNEIVFIQYYNTKSRMYVFNLYISIHLLYAFYNVIFES